MVFELAGVISLSSIAYKHISHTFMKHKILETIYNLEIVTFKLT